MVAWCSGTNSKRRLGRMIRQFPLLLFCLWSALACAERGYINTAPDDCPTGDGATIYDTRGNEVSGIPERGIVTINSLRKKPGFYWVHGHDFDGNSISGYVHKGCVTLGSPPAQPPIVHLDGTESPLEHNIEESPVVKAPPKLTDCNKFAEPSPGCKSFNDMLTGKDKDILTSLGDAYWTYVCFRTGEDVFTVVSVSVPTHYAFSKYGTSGTLAQTGIAFIDRYKNGVSESSDIISGRWSRLPSQEDADAAFVGSGAGTPKPKLYVTSSEISFSTTWKNVGGNVTSYNLRVRRSTRRLLETFEWPYPAPPNKATEHMTEEGYCEDYNAP